MQHKHQAGYFSQNVNMDALNYLRAVLNERQETPVSQSEVVSKIKDLDDLEPKRQRKNEAVPSAKESVPT